MKRALTDDEKIERIARGTHNMLMHYCKLSGDYGLTEWEDASEQQQADTIRMVKGFLAGGKLPAAEHAEWYAKKVAQGYVHGPVRNDDKDKGPLTNPNLLPYPQLPVYAQMKNILLPTVVFALAAHYGMQVSKLPELVYA